MPDFIETLFAIIEDRKANPAPDSYTNKLFERGLDKITQKVGEEAVEVVVAALNQSDERLLDEVADLAYHLLVLLSYKGLTPGDVITVLEARHAPGSVPEAAPADLPEMADLRRAAEHYRRGQMSASAGDFSGAVAAFDTALALDPGHVDSYIERGTARYRLGDVPGALEDLTAAIHHDPNNVDAYNNRGAVRHAVGNLPGAEADLTAALALDTGSAAVYSNRGAIRYKRGHLQAALEDLNQAIALDPAFAAAYYFRSLVRAGLGDQAGADADHHEAARLTEQNH